MVKPLVPEEAKAPKPSVHEMEALDAEQPPPASIAVAVDQRTATPQESKALLTLNNPGTLAELPKSQALYGLLEVGLRGSAMVLGYTMMRDMESDLRAVREELKEITKAYNEERLRNADLSSQLNYLRKLKILQNVLLTAGGLMNAAGLKFLVDRTGTPGFVFLAVGILLTIGGWLWPAGRDTK